MTCFGRVKCVSQENTLGPKEDLRGAGQDDVRAEARRGQPAAGAPLPHPAAGPGLGQGQDRGRGGHAPDIVDIVDTIHVRSVVCRCRHGSSLYILFIYHTDTVAGTLEQCTLQMLLILPA